ncbi:MAG: response regulator [Chitinispirillales bacterium]|jgi:PAS domain S-box-containing protein|nr:response regulator [Chitinispirillales bacterium]
MSKIKKNSVLVVDDDSNNIAVITNILKTDYIVYAAKDGQSAIDAAKEFLPDIILLDIIMPDMDGYAVMAELKNSEKTQDIPIILITGLSSAKDEEKGLNLGVADYIVKPFSPAIIKLRVGNQMKLIEQFRSNEYDIMKYKLSNDALKIALWDLDIVNGDPRNPSSKFTWSQEFRDALGFSDENDFPNTSEALTERFHPEDGERTITAFMGHLMDYTEKTPYDTEYRLKMKSGEYRYFHAFGTAQRDCAGIPLRMAGAVIDITEKKLMEEKAHEDEERMRLMLETMPLACRLFSRDGKVIDYNKAIINLFGLTDQEEYLGEFNYFSPDFQPCGRQSLDLRNELFNKGLEDGYLRFEWLHKKFDGEPLPCEVTLTRVKYKGEDIIAAYTRDLREQKAIIEEIRKAEIAEESSKTKSRFLATMSHEIRTPMNSIMGFAELAMEQATDPQIKEYLGKITDSTKWLLGIINDILDISKIEAGKMELENVPFNLQDVILRCQSVILPNLKEKGLELRLYMEPIVDKKLLGDPIRLYQIIMNLLSNAVKFTSTGTVKLSSLVKNLDNGKATLYFEVKDSGIGMSDEQTEKIFAPFIQADSSTTRNYGGTGLGLTIVKNIVELMGGKLSVESTPGIGSTFNFEIVFETIDASSDTSGNNDFSPLEKPYFDALVLICDDNPLNREVVCEHLTRVGIKTIATENGKEAVDMVTKRMQDGKEPFDLILMDIFMPIMDGVEAAWRITALNTGTPIVAMTANVMISELDTYRKNGMPDYLGKPFTSQELWGTLLKFLTPVSTSIIDNDEQARDKDELLKKLRSNFIKNNQSTYNEIIKAIENNDIILAHRIAHTLKGNAGMIGETKLQSIAAEMESMLRNGIIPVSISKDKINILKMELDRVLEALKLLLGNDTSVKETAPISASEISTLFEKMEPMLANINPTVVGLLDDIRAIPGAEELAHHIENYDFESAAKTLTKLKNRKPV